MEGSSGDDSLHDGAHDWYRITLHYLAHMPHIYSYDL